MSELRIREAGDSALLLELDDVIALPVNARAVAIAAAVRDAHVAGVRDVVPTFRAVAVYFDPLVTDRPRLESVLQDAAIAPARELPGRSVDVPVSYGGEHGPDLADVAAFAGLTEQQVVELHASRVYRVFMLGFLPGFPYLGLVDERIAVPRLESPRARVPAGSVGIAGLQTGIYPRDSPGGWRIIGRTPMRLFDHERTPPAVLAPGDTVRFVPASMSAPAVASDLPGRRPVRHGVRREGGSRAAGDGDTAPGGGSSRRVTVIRPGLLTTIQDAGRWGHQASGVPVSGPMDPFSHRLANALVGNARDAAALEVTIAGPELRLEHDARVALAGADLEASMHGAPMPMNRAVRGQAGSVIRFGARRMGARSYLAFDGGLSVPAVLGSRATHVLSGIGGMHGRALQSGDTMRLGQAQAAPRLRPIGAVASIGAGGCRLRVMTGPQDDAFPPEAIDVLQRTRFVVAPASNRMGYRLTGGRLPTIQRREMISTSMFTGGIQVPPSGDPLLLMAARQTTGGYPLLAVVITADLPGAGQLAPGDWVEFEVCSRREALAALVRQEGALLALE